MTRRPFPYRPLAAPARWLAALSLPGLIAAGAQAQDRAVYRCPGNLYTDQISVKEAAERGCKTLEGAPVTVIQTRRPEAPRAASGAAGATSGAAGASPRAPGDSRIDPAEQKARDTDARRILEAELRKEEDRLGALQKESGASDERGQPRSAERVAELKAAIARKEADVAAIRREIGKLGTP